MDIVPLEMDERGVVVHTNHYVLEHSSEVVEAMDWLPDTRYRLARVEELLGKAGEEQGQGGIGMGTICRILEDEREGNGASICRSAKVDNSIATLFRIVMDLNGAVGEVTVGRPARPEGRLSLLRKPGFEFEGVDEVKGSGGFAVNGDLPRAQEVM